ncbi:MAG: PEGA domain-containing protein, partial [Betaproteobacteria bacterium]|nr:PEGA domain-containing protein [Betaproteobacteria bacterium]
MKPSPQIIAPAEFRPPGALTGMTWPRLPWGMLIACLLVLLTLGVMGYLALARSVSLTATPPEAVVSVKGLLAPRIGNHWLLLPGLHRVEAAAPGYKPYDAEITVTQSTLQEHQLALTPLPGRLTLTVEPVSEATVSIDGKEAGKAPGVIEEIEAGSREVLIEAPRYMPFVARLEVRGKRQDETLAVRLTPAWADFKLGSQPAGALVS